MLLDGWRVKLLKDWREKMAQSELGRCNGVLALCLSLSIVKLPKDWREKLKKSSGFTWWFNGS